MTNSYAVKCRKIETVWQGAGDNYLHSGMTWRYWQQQRSNTLETHESSYFHEFLRRRGWWIGLDRQYSQAIITNVVNFLKLYSKNIRYPLFEGAKQTNSCDLFPDISTIAHCSSIDRQSYIIYYFPLIIILLEEQLSLPRTLGVPFHGCMTALSWREILIEWLPLHASPTQLI